MLKIFSYFIQSVFVYIFFILGRLIGAKFSRKFFSTIFSILGPLFKSRKVINKNLYIFNKNLIEIEKKKIISNMWKNYGMTFIEYIFLDLFRKKNSHIEIHGKQNLDDVIKKKKTVIFISGHFANFELMSKEKKKKKIELATIYRPLNNFFLNPLMEYLRRKYVCRNQIKKGINGVRETIEYIKQKHNIALMIDQRVSEGKQVNFFGKPALTTTLPAQLSIKYNLGIIPVFIERIKDDKFILEFKSEIKPKNFKNKSELTLELNKVLENMIVKNPNQWIWTHNRWK